MKNFVILTGLFLLFCSFLLVRQILVMRGMYGTGVGFGMIMILYLWTFSLVLFLLSLGVWVYRRRRGTASVGPAKTKARWIRWAWGAAVGLGLVVLAVPFVKAAVQSRGIADATFAEYCRTLWFEPPRSETIEPEVDFKGFETDYIYVIPRPEGDYPVYIRTDVFGKGHVMGAGG